MDNGIFVLTLTYGMPERFGQVGSVRLDPRDGKQRWMFGRCAAPGCRSVPDVGIGEHSETSLKHAQIRFSNGRFVIEDLRSRFGTQIRRDGKMMDVGEREIVLEDGDAIVFPKNLVVSLGIRPATEIQ